jgi:hypothetical protein
MSTRPIAPRRWATSAGDSNVALIRANSSAAARARPTSLAAIAIST